MLDTLFRKSEATALVPPSDAPHEPRASDDEAINSFDPITVGLDLPELVVQPVSEIERTGHVDAARALGERALDLDPRPRGGTIRHRPPETRYGAHGTASQELVGAHLALTFGSKLET